MSATRVVSVWQTGLWKWVPGQGEVIRLPAVGFHGRWHFLEGIAVLQVMACVGPVDETAREFCKKRPRRRVSAKQRQKRTCAMSSNESWSMDFMSDQLADGRWIRVLTIVDNFTRESLATEVESKFTGHAVTAILARLARERGCPKSIRVDSGPEFTSRALDQWAYLNKVELDFSRPGKPTDNAFIESFNGKLRSECLNQHYFMSLLDAKQKIGEWREDYNAARPHESLGYLAPSEFARKSQVKKWPERV